MITFTNQNNFWRFMKKHTKILLVDDEPDILEIVGYNLSLKGIKLLAVNGKDAIVKAKRTSRPYYYGYDAGNGWNGSLRKYRKIPELSNVLITFLTARSEDYSQVAGFDAGADDYITKPIKPKLLVSKVKALLRRKDKEINSETLNVGGIEINREEYKIVKDNIEIVLPRV
jgi:two-component system alkaline phosphatase synthesis response regulator PhoP